MRPFRILLSGLALVAWHWLSSNEGESNFEIPKWVSEAASRFVDGDQTPAPRYSAPPGAAGDANPQPRERFNYAARAEQHRAQHPVAVNTGRMVQKRELSMAYGCYWRLVEDLRGVDRRQKSRELGRIDAAQARAQIAARWREIDQALRAYNQRVSPEFRIALLACPIVAEV